MLKKYLTDIYNGKTLSIEEATELMNVIIEKSPPELQIAALLSALNTRPITPEELEGFRLGLFSHALTFDIDRENLIDVCGTGGDNKSTINISTLNGFVLAGAGYKVCKHGNFKFSSACGSSDILEAFGVKFSNKKGDIERSLERANYAYIHAPLFHPSLKKLAPIRQILGIRTFINLLGPLSNSLNPKHQLIGVYAPEIAALYAKTLDTNPEKKYQIAHSLEGYDEISLTSDFTITTNKETQLFKKETFKEMFGLSAISPEDILGEEDIEASMKTFLKVLKGEDEKKARCVIINAAFAIQLMENGDIRSAIEAAKTSLFSGKALKKFKAYVEVNQ